MPLARMHHPSIRTLTRGPCAWGHAALRAGIRSPVATAVLGRAGAAADCASCIMRRGIRGDNVLHLELMLPAVAKVILVEERITLAGDIVESRIAFALSAVRKVPVRRTIGGTTDTVRVQMGVRPIHGDLA